MITGQRSLGNSAQVALFLWSWVQNPVGVGSLLPSGRSLSRLMVQGLGPGSRVVELGPGTGTVTRAILEAGVLEEDLEVIEKDGNFARMLRGRFPGVAVHEIDAAKLGRRLGHLSGEVDCVISSLPLLLFSRSQRMRLVAGAFALLGPGGSLHQFTYAARCPIDARILSRLGLEATRIGLAAKNFPPAFVYKIVRSAAAVER
jgi:phosphatidylethanolamine/phosphatidyl-N-methylethanolamine N-methyltransferase